MNADGTGQTNLTPTPTDGDHVNEYQPTWAPSGDRIAYVGDVPGVIFTEQPDILVMDTDPGTAAVTNLTQSDASEIDPSWSPDGARIAFAGVRDGGWEIVAIDPDGANELVLTGDAFDGNDRAPDWSPDGSMVAFMKESQVGGCCEPWEIWAVNRDGTNMRQLTHLPCFNRDPSWSPDGKKVVFWSSSDHCTPSSGQGGYELYSVDPAAPASAPTRLNTKPNSGGPAWSPDGKSIAFSCDGYGGVGFEVCVMWNTDSTTAHRITNLNGDQADPAWSPEGRYIAFVNGGSLWIMRSDGSNAKQLVGGAIQPSW